MRNTAAPRTSISNSREATPPVHRLCASLGRPWRHRRRDRVDGGGGPAGGAGRIRQGADASGHRTEAISVSLRRKKKAKSKSKDAKTNSSKRGGEENDARRLVSPKKKKTQPPRPYSLSPETHLANSRDKPPTLTEGERAAALYNTACAHASLGDKRAALDALGAAVGEAGFADGRGAAADEDLAPLRGDPAFEALVGRLRAAQEREEEQQQKKKGFLGGLFG